MTMNKSALQGSVLLLFVAVSVASWSDVKVYGNGDSYEGSFLDGLRDGEGIYILQIIKI